MKLKNPIYSVDFYSYLCVIVYRTNWYATHI